MNNRGLVILLLAIAGFCALASAQVTKTYIGADGNSALDSSKWNPAGLPGDQDLTVFQAPARTVNVLSEATWGNLKVEADMIFVLQGGSLSLARPGSPTFLNGASISFTGGGSFSNLEQGPGSAVWPIANVESTGTSRLMTLDLRGTMSAATPTSVGMGMSVILNTDWSDTTEKTWSLGKIDLTGSLSGRTITVSTFNTSLTADLRTCVSCTNYATNCCVMNVTLADDVIFPGTGTDLLLNGDKVYLNVATSASATNSISVFTITSSYANIKGTWAIDNMSGKEGARLNLNSAPLPLSGSVSKVDLEGTFTSSSSGYVSCAVDQCYLRAATTSTNCHFEATAGTTIVQTDQISTSWLKVISNVVADVPFTVAKLLQANGRIVSGTVNAYNLTNDGNAGKYLQIAAGARVIVTGAADGYVIPDDYTAIVGIKTTSVDIKQTFNISGNGFVQVVDTSLSGDSFPDYARIASGPGSVLSFSSTTLNRNLGIVGGQLVFAPETTLTSLTVGLSMNSTLVAPNISITTVEYKYAGPNGGYALLLDATTTLKVTGKLRVLLPEGSVGYISGAGRLDVTEGTIETVSGKLIITTNFVGTITTTGGEIEFQPDPGVEQIFTNIALNGGYFSIPQSEYTLDSVTWISGGFSGTSANTLTVNNLSFQSGANKQLSNINVVVNTIIIGGNGDDMIFSGSGSTFTFVGDMTIPRNVIIDSGSVDFFNKGTITVSGTLGASTGRFIQTPASGKRGLYQDAPSTFVTVNPGGALTIQNLQNDGILELQGLMTGTINNNGAIYIGNMTATSKNGARSFSMAGDYNQNADTGELIFSIAGANAEDTDSLTINGTGNFRGKVTLNYGFSTSGIDPLTFWPILTYYSYSSKFSTVNTPGFTGQGTLVYLDNGAQYEFLGCHNEKESCLNCIQQTGDAFPAGCVWCRDVGACRAPESCPSGNSVAISSGQANQCPGYLADPLLYLLFIPAGLIIIGGVILLVIFLRRRAKGGSNDAAMLKRKPNPPEFLPIAFGKSMTESKLPRKDRDTYVPGLQKLKELITEKDLRILMAIINDDVTGATDIDRVSQAITYVFESQGRFLPLMYAMIDRELVQHNTNEGTLFRGNTVATTSWKFYSKLVGLEYLWNTLSDDIYLLVEKTSSGEISTEMDPVLLGEAEDVKVNKYQLLLTAQQILSKIIKSVEHIPLPLNMICHYLQEKVNEKYPSARYTAIGGFIFLRFLNPAINLPEAYGLTRKVPSKEARRVFVLITKTLQSLANNIKLGGKEQHMAKLNDFIDENQAEINQFFDDCATLPGGTTESSIQPIEIPENILLLSMVELHRHIYYNLPRIKEHLDSDAYDRLQAVVNGIGSPIKVENNN
jgi:hypothetical protein